MPVAGRGAARARRRGPVAAVCPHAVRQPRRMGLSVRLAPARTPPRVTPAPEILRPQASREAVVAYVLLRETFYLLDRPAGRRV
jgi:hypothetical protein